MGHAGTVAIRGDNKDPVIPCVPKSPGKEQDPLAFYAIVIG
jgi:hypothetical protein